jgi:hypothetical protein
MHEVCNGICSDAMSERATGMAKKIGSDQE